MKHKSFTHATGRWTCAFSARAPDEPIGRVFCNDEVQVTIKRLHSHVSIERVKATTRLIRNAHNMAKALNIIYHKTRYLRRDYKQTPDLFEGTLDGMLKILEEIILKSQGRRLPRGTAKKGVFKNG